jgi:digeranylgeranylglycerophospholipid reductase
MSAKEIQMAVIGGGPAGLSAALAAKLDGAGSVVVIERKRQWGQPIQCAGYAPRMLGRFAEFDATAIKHYLKSLELYLDGQRIRSFAAPGYILRRDVLETQMAQAAEAAGVVCLQPARALEISAGELRVQTADGEETYRPFIIIGADGPKSLARRALGLPDQPMAAGLEWELPLAKPGDAAEIHFAAEFGAGYAWLFPYGETAGVGVAVDLDSPGEPKPLLQDFVDRMIAEGRLKDSTPLSIVSGPIPIGGPAATTLSGNIMLVGDAAGQVNPLTGAGIYNAVACGQMAGRAAAQAAIASDLSLLQEYETEWRELLDGFLNRALASRTEMAKASIEDFPNTVRKAWRVKDKD